MSFELKSPSSGKTLPPPRTRRAAQRARLARLREESEPLIEEERRLALRALLRQPLLIPDGSAGPDFILVRRHRDWLADWFAHYADWSLVVTAEAARLRKVSAVTSDSTRGAVDSQSGENFNRHRYVLLCLALATLERSDRQITLGRLAEQIAMALAADPAFAACGFSWSLDQFAGRRDFVHTLRLLTQLGVLGRVEGNEERLLHDQKTDALYNVSRPVLGFLLAARRSPSLLTATEFSARLNGLLGHAIPDTPDARNRALRTHFVRRLLDDPVLYNDTLDEEQRPYLDRQRGILLPALEAASGFHAEARAEGLALVDLDGDCTDSGLPEEGTEGHLTLLLATWLADRLRAGDTAPMTVEGIRQQTAKFIRRHRHHWRREVTERGAEIWLSDLVLSRLEGLALIEREENRITARPALGRFALRATAELDGMENEPEDRAQT